MSSKPQSFPLARIRNFAIIAHVDHGKSTLSDRFIELCGGLEAREMRSQALDSMDIERERGITIKAQTARLLWRAADGQEYQLNLMDTPGHADFSYEVSRSLAACEASLALVDAAQGVEAQTIANVWAAVEAGHEIVPVLNKVDLPSADVAGTRQQLADALGLDPELALSVSAKTGVGAKEVLDAIVERAPAPKGVRDAPLKAMVVDSWHDPYLGITVLVRVYDGVLCENDTVRFMNAHAKHTITELGIFAPRRERCARLEAGEVGWFAAGVREIATARVGETITHDAAPCAEALPGLRPAQPMVFAGVHPSDQAKFEDLIKAAEKLRLNDAGFSFAPEKNPALGMGLRCGFLGMLHMEIVIARLDREHGVDAFTTAPSVAYRVTTARGEEYEVRNPAEMPDPSSIVRTQEPWTRAVIVAPLDRVGEVMALCHERRGIQREVASLPGRCALTYDLPLSEIAWDFNDKLKSVSRGHASMDFQMLDYQEGPLARMDILVLGDKIEALAMIVPRSQADVRGRALCVALRGLIPRHLFPVPIQAAIGGRIIARETVPGMRKDVTAKCYGGDVSRKRKLLDKQKAGKKRMRRFGRVDIPQEAFLAALRSDTD